MDKFVGRVVQRQLAAADFLVLNKTDLVRGDELAKVSAWLLELCPNGRIVEAAHGAVDPLLLLEPRSRQAQPPAFDLGARASSVFHAGVADVPPALCVTHLEQVLTTLPSTIHRIKGFVTDIGTARRLLVQVVGSRFAITAAPLGAAMAPDGLVVIGLDARDIQALCATVMTL